MKENSEIKNCFEFICPLKWKNLETTDNNDIKFCGSCKKQVFKANDFETFLKLSKENKCIAYIEDNTWETMGSVPLRVKDKSHLN